VQVLAPGVRPLVLAYVCAVLGVAVLTWVALGGEAFDGQERLFSLVAGTVVVTALTAWFGVRNARALRPQLRSPGFHRPEAWAALAALPILLVLNWIWHGAIAEAFSISIDDPFGRLRADGVSDTTLFVLVAAFPALTEEIAFRGLVQHWLQVAIAPTIALVVSAGLFTLLHFSLLSAPYLFLVGCVLGWAKWRTGSLWPSIVIHAAHNAAVLAWFRD
jgi:membrane protease YdiL (CAAX protease family)